MGTDPDPEELFEDEWEVSQSKKTSSHISIHPPRQYEIKMLWNTGHEALLATGSDNDLEAVERAYLSTLTLSEEEIAQLKKVPSETKVHEQRVVEIFCDGEWVVIPPRGAIPSHQQLSPSLPMGRYRSYAKVTLSNGKPASLVPVQTIEELASETLSLHHVHGRETAVLIGDPLNLDEASQASLRRLCACMMKMLRGTAGSLIDRVRPTVLSRWLEQVYQSLEESPVFVCAGVVCAGTIKLPDDVPTYHRNIFVVPGTQTADEAMWLAALTSAFAERHGSVAVLIGGGETAWQDVITQLAEHRRVLAVDGTGGVADQLSVAARGEAVSDRRAMDCVASGLIRTVPLQAEEEFEHVLRTVLTSW
ncbi:MAG: hypothetical protein ACRDIV_17535 [Ktedonobacteraceae bacterium]